MAVLVSLRWEERSVVLDRLAQCGCQHVDRVILLLAPDHPAADGWVGVGWRDGVGVHVLTSTDHGCGLAVWLHSTCGEHTPPLALRYPALLCAALGAGGASVSVAAPSLPASSATMSVYSGARLGKVEWPSPTALSDFLEKCDNFDKMHTLEKRVDIMLFV